MRPVATSALGWARHGHRMLLACHAAQEFLDILATKAAVATEGDQARDEALGGPSADRLGRHMQHSRHLARREVLVFVSVSHHFPIIGDSPVELRPTESVFSL